MQQEKLEKNQSWPALELSFGISGLFHMVFIRRVNSRVLVESTKHKWLYMMGFSLLGNS